MENSQIKRENRERGVMNFMNPQLITNVITLWTVHAFYNMKVN